MLEADWLEMGSTTATVYHATGFDGDGTVQYSTGTPVPAIVHACRRNVHMADGRVEQATSLIFLLSTSLHVGNADKVVTADSTTPGRVLLVDHTDDEEGQHHVEVTLG